MNATLTPGRYLAVCASWLALAAAVFFLCMMLGQGDFGTHAIAFHWPDHVTFRLRFPRVLATAIVGMALSAAGVTLQALLRNPLAEPYVLGISSGSAIGVLIWLILTGPLYASLVNAPAMQNLLASGRSIPSVIGALLTSFAVFAIARRRSADGSAAIEPITLLLVGVIISAINASLLMIVNSLSEKGLKENLANFMLGSILEGDLSNTLLIAAAAVFLLAFIPVLLAAPALNVGTFSDVEATSLGVSIRKLRLLCFLCASIMTGAALMLSGPIGFVGLICPHICRHLIGSDHRKLIIAAPLCGAAFLMLADTAVRITLNIFGTEFPVGVVTALCGGPFFLFLLKRGPHAGARA